MRYSTFAITALVLMLACTPGADEQLGGKGKAVHVTDISLDKASVTIKEGEIITLVATITPDNSDNKTVIWSSSSDAVAVVDNTGKVTGIKAGRATITATAEDGGLKATCAMSVEANLAPSVTVEAKNVSAISAVLAGKANLGSPVASDLKVGFQYLKSAGILPSNSTTVEADDADADYNYTTAITGFAPDTKYYFRSFVRQNGQDTYGETKEFTTKDVASLLETQDATEIKAAKATLNAKLDLTDVLYESMACGFLLGTSELALNTDYKSTEIKDDAIFASVTGLSHKTQYWYKAYVTLDSQTFYGEVKTFTTDIVPVESVYLDTSECTFNTIGKMLTLRATVLPADATDKTVTWASDDEAVATVNSSGTVKAIGNGTANITVTTTDQDMKAICVITVAQLVTSINIHKTSIALFEGQEQMLLLTVNPSTAANKHLNWTSNNTSVATVDSEGKVTAVSKGTATIKAEASDGSGEYATCSIEVYKTEIPQAVDMGTLVNGKNIKWASFNIGASSPEDYGPYFIYGETVPAAYIGKPSATTSINNNSENTISAVLNLEDDVAHVILGDSWRLPTYVEWMDLMEKCKWTWTTQNGINGRLVIASNGNSIFLPAAGQLEIGIAFDPAFSGDSSWWYETTSLEEEGACGYYWSSSINESAKPYGIYFNSFEFYGRPYDTHCLYSVRPVSE